jgi:hypothetical protein
METFSKVLKYKKPTLPIDEKIEKLDIELKKTLGETLKITNSTSGLYTITQYIDPVPAVPAVPPKYSDKVVGYGLYIPPGGSIYSPGAYYYPIYELIDPGSPEIPAQPGYMMVFSRNSLGDPNYYPGPISPPDQQVAGNVNYNIYNYILRTFGMDPANWYENNPTAPHGANPHLPSGAYVPLAMNSEIMNKLNMSQEAASTLIAQVNAGPSTPIIYDASLKQYVPNMGAGRVTNVRLKPAYMPGGV